MPSARSQYRHRRSSSTPEDTAAIAAASSLLAFGTDRFTSRPRTERRPTNSTRRVSSSGNLNYTYSFRRSEHVDYRELPPSYESLTAAQPNIPSYSLDFVRSRPRSSSSLATPISSIQCQIPTPSTAGRQRALSSPVSPIVSPLSSDLSAFPYRPYRPSYTMSPLHPNASSPVGELPSPFSSPLFYWNGQSNQQLTAMERIHQAQIEDLSLMSPFGSPSFYWDGVSRQEVHEESTLDRAKKAWGKLVSYKLGGVRPKPSQNRSGPRRTVWDDAGQHWVFA